MYMLTSSAPLSSIGIYSNILDMDSSVSGTYYGQYAQALDDGYNRPALFFWDTTNENDAGKLVPRWERDSQKHVMYQYRNRIGITSGGILALNDERSLLNSYNTSGGIISAHPPAQGFCGIRWRDVRRNSLFRFEFNNYWQANTSAGLTSKNRIRWDLKFGNCTASTSANMPYFQLRPEEWIGATVGLGLPLMMTCIIYFTQDPKPGDTTVPFYARFYSEKTVWAPAYSAFKSTFYTKDQGEISWGNLVYGKDLVFDLTYQQTAGNLGDISTGRNYVRLDREG